MFSYLASVDAVSGCELFFRLLVSSKGMYDGLVSMLALYRSTLGEIEGEGTLPSKLGSVWNETHKDT